MTIHVMAIYANGVLKPLEPLELEENETVELELTPVDDASAYPPEDFASLYGIWREHASEIEAALEEARRVTAAKLERLANELSDP